MRFNITLPDGSVVEKATDQSGLIEIKGLTSGSTCDISYEPDDSKYPHAVFYERFEASMPKKANPTGQKLIWEKTGLRQEGPICSALRLVLHR
jgi:hypothetical protein